MSAVADNPVKKPRGRPFQKGQSGNPAGKPRGKSHTTLIREAAIEAANRAGDTVNAKRAGMAGYLEWVAVEQPSAFIGLLGKVLPTQITGADEGPVRSVHEVTVRIVDPDGDPTD